MVGPIVFPRIVNPGENMRCQFVWNAALASQFDEVEMQIVLPGMFGIQATQSFWPDETQKMTHATGRVTMPLQCLPTLKGKFNEIKWEVAIHFKCNNQVQWTCRGPIVVNGFDDWHLVM